MSQLRLNPEKTPILEAILDLQAPMPLLSEELLLKFATDCKKKYWPATSSYLKPVHTYSGGFAVQESGISSTTNPPQLVGFKLDVGTDFVVVFKRNGFSVSRVCQTRKYVDFQELIAFTEPIKCFFIKKYSLKQISRLALRYINRFELPKTEEATYKPSQIFKHFETEANTLFPESFTNFSYIVQAQKTLGGSYDSLLAHYILQLQSDTIIQEREVLPVFLDIDVFTLAEFHPDKIWSVFDALKTIRTQIFRDCLTQSFVDEATDFNE